MNIPPFSALKAITLLLMGSLPLLGQGALTWTSLTVNVAAKSGDKEVVAPFNFTNTGTTPVTIRDIHPSCECTVAELAQRTYAPGESGTIKAIFTVGARTGRQDKVISVTTDDPSAPTITLNLRIDIEELLALSTRMLRWKIGSAPEEQAIELSALGQHRIAALELKETSPKEQAQVRIEPLEPGVKYRLFIRPDTLEQSRTVTLTFVAHFAGDQPQTFVVFALAR